MPGSNPIVRVLSPNLGKPALVANDADGLHFEAFVVSDSSGVNVCAVLNGRLFLQELEDTQEVVQKAASSAQDATGQLPQYPDDGRLAHGDPGQTHPVGTRVVSTCPKSSTPR